MPHQTIRPQVQKEKNKNAIGIKITEMFTETRNENCKDESIKISQFNCQDKNQSRSSE